jgi:hypothetical protein
MLAALREGSLAPGTKVRMRIDDARSDTRKSRRRTGLGRDPGIIEDIETCGDEGTLDGR